MIPLLPRALPLLALLLCALPAAAQEEAAAPDSTPSAGWIPRLQRAPVVGDVMLLGEGAAHAITGPLRWDRRDLARLGLAVGGVATVSLLDEAGRDLMEEQRAAGRWDRWERRVEPFGRLRGIEVLGGFYAAGLLLGDAKLRNVAAEGLATSLVASVLITPPLTEVFGRPRPREQEPAHTFRPFSDNHSLPSGHTTQAFAVASVIATEYPHPAVQAAAYGTAAAVGLSRMYRGSHFLSDVTAAAVIGTTVGRAVARYGQRRRDRLGLRPLVLGGTGYLVLTHPF